MVVASGCNSAMVSWNAQQSRMCDVVIVSYSVRYRLTGSSGGYDTVSTSSTSATLESLVPNADYDVEVATVDSNAVMSAYSTVTQLSMQGNFCMCSISVLFHVVVVVVTSSHLGAVSVQLYCVCFQHAVRSVQWSFNTLTLLHCRSYTSNRCISFSNWM